MNISDKVVCVDDSPSKNTGQKCLERGKVYVVEGVDEEPYCDADFALYLVGVPNALHTSTGTLLGWGPKRFRLLDELKAEAAAAQNQRSLQIVK